nr:MAG TPA: hypothetical protein [Caudoviricetes sp.]
MWQPKAIAIVSSWNNVGDVFPFSMLFSVLFPIPVFSANCINVQFFFVRISHSKTFILHLLSGGNCKI